jgi:hypothetical protein
MQHIQIPTLSYQIIMQERYEAAKATIKAYKKAVAISKNKSSIYSNSEGSDDGPLSDDENVPKKTDTNELKIDESLLHFIEALPHLEPIHYGFDLQRTNQAASCMCSSARCLNPGRTTNGIDTDYELCRNTLFKSQGLLQHCAKGDNYHEASTNYLKELYDTSSKKG